MERLSNDQWGFESNCFVCEERNGSGLRIPFFHDRDSEQVFAEFSLNDAFSGAPAYAHGGVVLAILDEAMAWATIALEQTFAVTVETSSRFRQPVRIGERYQVHARVVGDDGAGTLSCEAEVVGAGGAVCATAAARFVALGPAKLLDATRRAPHA